MKTVLLFIWSQRSGCMDRICGVRRFARMCDWRVQVVERGGPNGRIPVHELIDLWQPIGCIAECGGEMPEIAEAIRAGVPTVLLDQDPALPYGNRHVVRSDATAIGTAAAKALLECDLQHFAFVGHRYAFHWSQARLTAFRQVLALHGLTCDEFTLKACNDSFQWNHALGEWLVKLPKRCGVFAANDAVGELVLSAAAERKIAVPDDLSVIGVDDNREICENALPPLTSIRPDFEDGGYRCAELLSRLIGHPELPPETQTFGPVYIARRESTGDSKRRSYQVSRAIQYIRQNASRHIGLQDVARVMKCSGRHAETRFAREVGHSVLAEITRVRVSLAKSLLTGTSDSLSLIAQTCGWASVSSLRTAFKAETGVSPLAWRKGCHG